MTLSKDTRKGHVHFFDYLISLESTTQERIEGSVPIEGYFI